METVEMLMWLYILRTVGPTNCSESMKNIFLQKSNIQFTADNVPQNQTDRACKLKDC